MKKSAVKTRMYKYHSLWVREIQTNPHMLKVNRYGALCEGVMFFPDADFLCSTCNKKRDFNNVCVYT